MTADRHVGIARTWTRLASARWHFGGGQGSERSIISSWRDLSLNRSDAFCAWAGRDISLPRALITKREGARANEWLNCIT